jgi:hypothetical protein
MDPTQTELAGHDMTGMVEVGGDLVADDSDLERRPGGLANSDERTDE